MTEEVAFPPPVPPRATPLADAAPSVTAPQPADADATARLRQSQTTLSSVGAPVGGSCLPSAAASTHSPLAPSSPQTAGSALPPAADTDPGRPSSDGDAAAGDGSVKPDRGSAAALDGSGAVKPDSDRAAVVLNGGSTITLNNKGATAVLGGGGAVRLNNRGATVLDGGSAINPNDKGATVPGGGGAIKPNAKGSTVPGGGGAVKPNDKGAAVPDGAAGPDVDSASAPSRAPEQHRLSQRLHDQNHGDKSEVTQDQKTGETPSTSVAQINDSAMRNNGENAASKTDEVLCRQAGVTSAENRPPGNGASCLSSGADFSQASNDDVPSQGPSDMAASRVPSFLPLMVGIIYLCTP